MQWTYFLLPKVMKTAKERPPAVLVAESLNF